MVGTRQKHRGKGREAAREMKRQRVINVERGRCRETRGGEGDTMQSGRKDGERGREKTERAEKESL